MATKKFIIEVEEGWTKCDKDCPFAGAAFLGYQCGLHNEIGFGELQCTKYNLATMKIKKLEEEKMKAEDIYNKALTEYPIKEKLNKKAVGTYDANCPRRKAFVAGAEWMQEKMIEKAAEWLYVYYPTLERSKSFEDAWTNFKQAMQDESK